MHASMISSSSTFSQSNNDIDFSVKVLTNGHWPNIDSKSEFALPFPPKISDAINSFTQFYLTKFANGRTLSWKLHLGTAELKGIFAQGSKKYEFVMSTYQMFLVLLFEQQPVDTPLTYQQVLQMT